MWIISIRILGYALMVLMAKWAGESLQAFQNGKRAKLCAFLLSGLSVWFLPFYDTILLMYLLTQSFADIRDGYVDVTLNLQANACMAVCALALLPRATGLIWLCVACGFLYLTQNVFSSGDRKGLFACALWGLIYLNRGLGVFRSGQYLPMPCLYGLLVTFGSTVLYGLITKKRYDVPLFPWLFLGMGSTIGTMATTTFLATH